jgi:RNA polymerase sigma-70 factor (ECF subfamily)
VPDSAAFVEYAEPFRRELFAHCYRLLGSVSDAEDLVQETYLRAWRSYEGFEGRSSMRTWLYRIATNACLTALAKSTRRMLPSGLGAPEPDPEVYPAPADPEITWLDPVPDTMVVNDTADPAAIVAARAGLRLALIASMQYLPPRQRAVLVLRDVLEFPAAEVAVMLGTTTVSVKSALQRARARMEELAPAAEQIIEPTAPQARALLDQYIAAFENADAAALERLLVRDAVLEATPMRTWFAGVRTCVPFLRDRVIGSPGTWRMLPTRANGQPAAVEYVRDEQGAFQAYGVVVLTANRAGIVRVTSFGDPRLVSVFGGIQNELERFSRLGLTWANGPWAEGCPQVKRAQPTFSGGSGSGLDCCWVLPGSMISRVRSWSSASRARSFLALSNSGWYSVSSAGVSRLVTVLPPILRVHSA